MAVIEKQENDKLVLDIDGDDKQKIDAVMQKWNFKDQQSFLRFISSILLDTKGNSVYLETDNGIIKVSPATHLLKDVTEEKVDNNGCK